MTHSDALINSATVYITENLVFAVIVPTACTSEKFFIQGNTAPGGATSWTYTIRAGTSIPLTDTAIACSLTGAATTCNATASIAIAAGTLIDMKMAPSGTPGEGQVTATFFCQ